MKKVIGLLILILVLVAVSGCTQQAKPASVTTAIPTTVQTVEATTIATPAPTTEVPVATTVVETATEAANVTAMNVTTMAPTATQTVTMSMTPSTKITTVHMANGTFTPSVLMVLPGTGINWVNDDNTVHSVKMIGDHAGMFNSGDILAGGKWSFTFDQNEGTYQYADGYNANMTGTIIVKSGEVLYGGPTQVPTATATTSP